MEKEEQDSEESEEEGEIGDSQTLSRRSTRVRKSDWEKRERETYKDKLKGSQPMLEKLLAKTPKITRSEGQGPKGATQSLKVNNEYCLLELQVVGEQAKRRSYAKLY